MTRKSQPLYIEIFRRVVFLAGNMQNIEHIYCDYECALRNAARDIFGNVRGCFFHFAQAIMRKSKSVGLQRPIQAIGAVKNWMRHLVALALLPPNLILNGFMSIRQSQYEGLEANMRRQVEEYFENYWIGQVTADQFSVHGQPHRTTNDIEVFHRTLHGRVKVAHANIWKFLGMFLYVV